MKRKKKICVVITARASYSRIKSALKAIDEHEDLELILVVAASALLDRYGSAVEVIQNDGSVSYTHLTLPTKRIV